MSNVAAESSSAIPEQVVEFGDLLYADVDPETPEEPEETEESASEESEGTAPDSEPEETTTEKPEDEPKPESKPETKPRTNAEKRIQQLLADKKRLEQQIAGTKPEAKPETKPEPKVEELKAPSPENFETWDAYNQAHSEFLQKTLDAKVKAAVERDRQEQADKAAAETQKTELAKARKTMDDRQKATEKRLPDLKAKLFDESGALREDIVLHPVFDNFIPKSEVGWDVLHHIATHPEEMAKIAAMDDFAAAGEFHRLQSEITAKLQAPPRKPLKPSRTVSGTTIASSPKSFEAHLYGED